MQMGNQGEIMGRRPSGRSQNPRRPPTAVASRKQKKSSTRSPQGLTNKNVGTKASNNPGQVTGKNARLHRLFKRLFGTRLRAFATGIITLVIAPAIATIIATVAPHLWSTSSEQQTHVIYYEPWDTYNPYKIMLSNLHIDRIISGHCWVSSIVTTRSDAYRCLSATNNIILDPCLAYPFSISSAEVACPYPDPNSITIIRLTRPLPQPSGRNVPLPTAYWFIILADGTKCFTAGGTTDFIGSEKVRGAYYYCPGIGYPLYGYPDTSGRIWTILEQRPGESGLEPAPIATAYS